MWVVAGTRILPAGLLFNFGLIVLVLLLAEHILKDVVEAGDELTVVPLLFQLLVDHIFVYLLLDGLKALFLLPLSFEFSLASGLLAFP